MSRLIMLETGRRAAVAFQKQAAVLRLRSKNRPPRCGCVPKTGRCAAVAFQNRPPRCGCVPKTGRCAAVISPEIGPSGRLAPTAWRSLCIKFCIFDQKSPTNAVFWRLRGVFCVVRGFCVAWALILRDLLFLLVRLLVLHRANACFACQKACFCMRGCLFFLPWAFA